MVRETETPGGVRGTIHRIREIPKRIKEGKFGKKSLWGTVLVANAVLFGGTAIRDVVETTPDIIPTDASSFTHGLGQESINALNNAQDSLNYVPAYTTDLGSNTQLVPTSYPNGILARGFLKDAVDAVPKGEPQLQERINTQIQFIQAQIPAQQVIFTRSNGETVVNHPYTDIDQQIQTVTDEITASTMYQEGIKMNNQRNDDSTGNLIRFFPSFFIAGGTGLGGAFTLGVVREEAKKRRKNKSSSGTSPDTTPKAEERSALLPFHSLDPFFREDK